VIRQHLLPCARCDAMACACRPEPTALEIELLHARGLHDTPGNGVMRHGEPRNRPAPTPRRQINHRTAQRPTQADAELLTVLEAIAAQRGAA
jgi:hypothetical protein